MKRNLNELLAQRSSESQQRINEMADDLLELADIDAYDRAKSQPSDPVPFSQAIKEIDENKLQIGFPWLVL
jgi:hypothetical protein